MRAGLQRHIERGAARGLAGAPQRLGLGMRPAARLGPAAADDDAVLDHDRADGRVRPGAPEPAPAERQRQLHEALIRGFGFLGFLRVLVFQNAEDHLRNVATPRVVFAGEFAEHGLEVLGLAEIAIDRGEAHIGDVVELAQMLHHDLADRLRGDFRLAAAFELAHDRRTPSSRPAPDPTGRLRKLICSERTSLSRSNGTRRPLRLITVSSRNCTRSKVVKRKLQAMHTRRRRITAESSVGRESFTCVSRLLQLGTAHPTGPLLRLPY